jgi:hypothetical protein
MSRIFPPALSIVVLSIVFSINASATTYYISTSGSDSNSGTSESAPWAHLPGMQTWTGSYAPAAGDTFVLRGCDDWGNSSGSANFPINWTWSGTSSSHITISVDQSTPWYNTASCSSWNRPVFDGQLAIMNAGSNPTGCSAFNGFMTVNNSQYVDFNWIEFKGWYWTDSAPCFGDTAMLYFNNSDYITINYSYFHYWSHGSSAGDSDHGIFSQGSPLNSHGAVTYSVLDNTDGYALTGTSTGVGVQIPLQHSICVYLANCIKTAVAGEYAYNDISKDGAASLAGVHNNCIETLSLISGTTYYIHDNKIHDNFQCEGLQVGNPNEVDYVWNNLFYNMTSSGANGPDIPQSCSTGVSALYYWNNTNVDSRNVCASFQGCSGSNWTNAFVMQNNHCITSGTPGGSEQSGGMLGGGTVTGASIINISNNLVESLTTANGQGYTSSQTYPYSPASAGSPTIGQGANLSSNWPSGFSTNDTTLACSEQTVNGVVESVCPMRPSNTRPPAGPTPWDIGAYTFGSTPNPPTGLSAAVQ